MENIAKEMKVLWHNYWDKRGHGSTYAEKYDRGVDGVERLLLKDGVYALGSGFTSKTPEEKIINPKYGEIETWNINGQTANYDYDK